MRVETRRQAAMATSRRRCSTAVRRRIASTTTAGRYRVIARSRLASSNAARRSSEHRWRRHQGPKERTPSTRPKPSRQAKPENRAEMTTPRTAWGGPFEGRESVNMSKDRAVLTNRRASPWMRVPSDRMRGGKRTDSSSCKKPREGPGCVSPRRLPDSLGPHRGPPGADPVDNSRHRKRPGKPGRFRLRDGCITRALRRVGPRRALYVAPASFVRSLSFSVLGCRERIR